MVWSSYTSLSPHDFLPRSFSPRRVLEREKIVSFSDSYQIVVELVSIRVRVRVASQLSNFLFHLLFHHPRYHILRLRIIIFFLINE